MKFKIIITCLTATFLLFSVSRADVSFLLDFKVGLNLSKGYGPDYDEWFSEYDKIKIGLITGFGFGIKIRKIFTILPEMLFTMKGLKSEGFDEMNDKTIYRRKLNYLEFPILFKINIPAGVFIPNLYVGPSLGILLSAKFEIEEPVVTEIVDIKDDIKNIDFGLAFGSGLDIAAGPGRFIFDIRFTLGFLTIYEDESYDINNIVFSFIAGYGFDIGKSK